MLFDCFGFVSLNENGSVGRKDIPKVLKHKLQRKEIG